MTRIERLLGLGVSTALLGLACGGGAPASGPQPKPGDGARSPRADGPPNFLILIADDLGVDKLRSYGHAKSGPKTPALDALADEGVSFDRAWAMPVCSPTRATLLTGKHAFRTGMGLGVQPHEDEFTLSYDEVTLPEMLQGTRNGYTTGAFGKWHLGIWARDEDHDPQKHGFDVYEGSLANLKGAHTREGGKQTYTSWEKTENGKRRHVTNYATTETTDDALEFIRGAKGPWLAWVAYNAPHSPYHVPPRDLFTGSPPADTVGKYDAMVQAMDHEIGRLIAGLGDGWERDTYVIFIGDNGTPSEATVPPMDPKRAKHTVYEGGIKVPLIVAGPGVARGKRSDALAVSTDVFATVAELAGAKAGDPSVKGAVDSVSLVPQLMDPAAKGERTIAYSERFEPNGFGPYSLHDWAIRDDRYKLIHAKGRDYLYDLGDGWVEGDNLLQKPVSKEARAARQRLEKELQKLRG